MTTRRTAAAGRDVPDGKARRLSRVLGLVGVLLIVVVAGTLAGIAWTLGPGASSGIAGIGGPFALMDQDGRPITDRDLLGKPTAVFFGYTHCPEACPTTLMDMTDRLKALGPDADRFNVLMISLDPDRDKPALLKAYLESFDPRIRAATGTPEAIASVAKAYRVYYQKSGEGEGYTIDHSTAVYLLDARGGVQTLIDYQEPQDQAVAKMRKVLAL